MASDPPSPPAKPRAITADELPPVLEAHREWVKSRGTKGARADLSGRKLPPGADLAGADLTDADLSGTTLVRVNLAGAKLRRANLAGALLDEVNLADANLEDADLSRACIRNSNLTRADLEEARLDGATVQDSDLSGANLIKASLRGAKVVQSPMAGVRMHKACLAGCDLTRVNLTQAVLEYADLTGANLRGAKLGDADLRHVRGLRLDQTFIRDARFTPVAAPLWSVLGHFFTRRVLRRAGGPRSASDPWSVLRQSYAGPRLAFLLCALVAFVLPYVARIHTLSVLSQVESTLERGAGAAQKLAAESGVAEVPPGTVTDLKDRFEKGRRPVWWVLLKIDRGPAGSVLAALLILYNLCLAVLVRRVGPMRDEEERSGYSPAWASYRRLLWLHRTATVLLAVSFGSFLVNCWELLTQPVFVPNLHLPG
jgi:uncharacterized protein YjbI with pentapeptide repeats